MPEISVIMPFYNHWDLTHARMMEIHKFFPADCEIILVNDASTDVDCDGGVAFWQQADTRQKIRYTKNKENLGFGGSMNKGAKLAKGNILIFLSNDVIMTNNWVGQVQAIISQDENVLIGGRIVYWPGGWNEFQYKGNTMVVPYAEGWLLACTRKVWDNLGGFDLRYGKYAFEDIDLSTTAILKGYRLIGLNSKHLNHLAGQTAKYDESRMKLTERNKEIYIAKWNDRFDEVWEGSQNA